MIENYLGYMEICMQLYINQNGNKGNTKKLQNNDKNITKRLQGNIKYITFVSVKETNTKTNDSNESTSW